MQLKEGVEMQEKRGIAGFILIAMGILIIGMVGWFMLSYNTIVSKEEQVKTAWSQVESNLQRKLDLLPNLVKVVKRYAIHEKKLLIEITRLRAQASHIVLNGKVPDGKDIAALQKMQKQFDSATLKLFAIAENYPELKSSEQFLQLQSQIEGTENRINITRMQFNEVVGSYNAYLRHIPANIVASVGGFKSKAYYKADAKAHQKLKLGL